MRAVIFANGELRDAEAVVAQLSDSDLVLAANGGARHCAALGLTPAAVIGDLDSLPAELRTQLEAEGVEIVGHPRRKDQTDLELALLWARSAGAEELQVVAGIGGRLDQTIANLLLCVHPELQQLPITFLDGSRRAMTVRRKLTIRGRPGDRVSLIPLDGDAAGVTTSGLEYRLLEGRLPFGATLGISNALAEPQAEIRVRSGQVLLIHETDE